MRNRVTKILVIDGNKDNLISLKALIKEAFTDIKISTALTGQKGLEHTAAEDFDVILLDINIPEMDGFNVCKKLKTDQATRDIPIIFINAQKEDKENRLEALECGGDAFLYNPIDEIEVTTQIHVMLKIRNANLNKEDENARLEALMEEKSRELKDSAIKT